MNRLLEIQKKVVPDVLETLEKRYRILQLIRSTQPIGRRSLTQMIGMTERIVRSQTDFLKEQGLLNFSRSGMSLSPEGEKLLTDMDQFIKEWFGLTDLEEQLRNKLNLSRVIITPGDSAKSVWIKKDLGRVAVNQLKELVEEECIVAVGGGTTMAEVADAMYPHPKFKNLHFVPARGGLGEKLEIQAGTICSKMAARSGGNYRLLHVPDPLTKESYQSLLNDPQIDEIVSLIRSARIIIHGIGKAQTMARRRNAKFELMEELNRRGAMAEAFGYYFNHEGKVVWKVRTIGLQLEDMHKAKHIIAVAGGNDKAAAIVAFLKHEFHDVLITDEGAAREMAKIV